MRKQRAAAALALALLLLLCPARARAQEAPQGSWRAAALVEQSTGRVLYAENGDEELPMASTTKIMTALCAVESGRLGETVEIDRRMVGIEGSSIYLAGQSENGTHHRTKYLREEDYLPIGSIIRLDDRNFRVDHVNFMFKSVSLQDMDLTNSGQPIFRSEGLPHIRELYEQQQNELAEVAPEKTADYKVGDSVVVDLPTKTIKGTIGYVGETDVRIDTSAQGYSWSNEVLNKEQFEDGLRQDEPTPDEELDKLPISAEVDGKWQTFPDAVALDEALNAVPAGNFRITDDHLGEGGAKQKYARNIEAIRTLFKLEEEHRGATAEEQQVLSQYVGWGGLADAFDPDKDNWAKEYAELKGLLSEDEYAAARSSTLNAHYTSPVVIRSIYDAVEKMGFQSGNILEPSMGVGNFFGMLPDSMADSRLYGVELDSITGRIAKKLYPQADITVAGFETTDRRDFYDLAVGNVPFGQYKVNDKAYNKLGFSMRLRIWTVWMPSRNYCRPPSCARQGTPLPDILVLLECVR